VRQLPTVLLFPGQGCQRVGMGADLVAAYPAAARVFEEVDDALGRRLSATVFHGSQAELTLTRNAQPALLAFCVAAYAAGAAATPDLWSRVGVVMGHSVGEYAAAVVTGALPLRAAARILAARADAMQVAADAAASRGHGPLGMQALLLRAPPRTAPSAAAAPPTHAGHGAPPASWAAFEATLSVIEATVAAERSARGDGAVLSVASVNSPAQVVLAGEVDAMTAVVATLKARGLVGRAVSLDVSAPFHTPLMAPAAAAVAAALREHGVGLAPAALPIIANASGAPVSAAADVAAALVDGITAPVRWAQGVAAVLHAPLPPHVAAAGGHHFMELAPAPTVSSLSKACDTEGAAGHSCISTAQHLAAFCAGLPR